MVRFSCSLLVCLAGCFFSANAQDTIPFIDTVYNAPYVAIPYAYHQDDTYLGYSSKDLSELDNYDMLTSLNILTGERIQTGIMPGNLNFKTDDSTFFKIVFLGGDVTHINEYEFISPAQLNFKRTVSQDLHYTKYLKFKNQLFRPTSWNSNGLCEIVLMDRNLNDSILFSLDSNYFLPQGGNRFMIRNSFLLNDNLACFNFQDRQGPGSLISCRMDSNFNLTIDTLLETTFMPVSAVAPGFLDLTYQAPYYYLQANHEGPSQSRIFSVYQLDSNLQKTGNEIVVNGDSLKDCCGYYRDPYAIYKITNDHHIIMQVSTTSLGLTHLDTVRSMIRKYKPNGSLVWERCFNPRGMYSGNSLNSIHELGDTAYAVLGSFSFGPEHEGRHMWYFVLDTNGANYQLAYGVGMDEENKFSIYPNPARNEINLVGAFSAYTIITVQGQIVLRGRMEDNTIDISNLQPGAYFLVNENGFAQRFIAY